MSKEDPTPVTDEDRKKYLQGLYTSIRQGKKGALEELSLIALVGSTC